MTDPPESRAGLFTLSKNEGKTDTYLNGELIQSYEQVQPALVRTSRGRPLRSDVLVSARLKIERAKGHIADLKAAAQAFFKPDTYVVTHEFDPQTGENVYRMVVNELLPHDISLILGDAVHNLRCALDYMVCDLARANSCAPHQNGGLPIDRTAKRLKPGTIAKIKGVSPAAERLILRIKACDAINARLFELNILDNIDKHNTIVTVAAATAQISALVGVPGIFIGPDGSMRLGGPGPDGSPYMINAGAPSQFRRVFPLENNVEIYRSPSAFNEEIQVAVDIAFGKVEILQIEGKPVIPTLDEFTELAERIIGIFQRRVIKDAAIGAGNTGSGSESGYR